MKTEIIKDIRQGFETAYINGTLASNLEYKPSFVSNNPKEGKKVISTIEEELLRCEHFQISVAFITMGGITPLLQTLKELERKGVVGEILTTNYLNFSEPRALEKLNELSNITLKMYDVEVADSGFHTKGYIFKKEEVYRIILGSSNMTSAALTSNIEWNTKIISSEQGEVASEIIKEFNNLWNSDYALDFETFYEIYKVRYELIKHQREEAKKDIVPSFEKYTLKPNSMQEEFIINLRKIIEKGEEKALLISATGTGKTYASAFAVRELGFKRVLFIVHRAQLAKQAKKSFERVFNNSVSMGIVGDGKHEYDSDFIFAMVETLNRDEHLFKYKKDTFDCIIYAKHWIEDIVWEMNTDEEDTTSEVRSSSKDKRNKGFIAHIDKLRSYLDAPEEIHLGRKPEDLLETLVNMVLGSPAICIYRSNGRSTARATSLAKVFVNNFNLPESTAIIDLAYGRCRDDNSHWQNVLKYCKDGCFQAMIDEYIHMLKETAGFQSDGNQYQIVHDMMMDSLKIHTATYIADTYPDFKKRINGADRKSDGCRIRSSYAVGFTKDAGDNSKVVMRKENIRNAFNSPMRPFVLATTSIGQEGLDFHNYCRVIMHWNLPSNPIDLEQREGRINRFKCLAIRQNVADKYGKADEITFKRDIWTEMFEAAKAEKQNDQSELVPFWCFGKNQSVKIERLVPMYPMSKDEMNYERLIKILSLYRLTLGQARQEELLEYLFKEFKDTSGLKKLFIDLSPFSKGKEG